MEKSSRKHLSGWIGPKARKNLKHKIDSNQLTLPFPAIQASLPLEEEEAFFLPRRRQENDWKVVRYWEALFTQKGSHQAAGQRPKNLDTAGLRLNLSPFGR